MIAVKINNPEIEQELAALAKTQKKSRQAVARSILEKQLEDAIDYRAAVAASQRLASGETVARPISELWRKLGLDD